MGKLLWNEIKKAIQTRSTHIYMLIVIAASLFFSWYCVSLSGTDSLESDGQIKVVTGTSAIPLQKQTESLLSGPIDEEKLEEALQTVQYNYDEIRDEFLYNEKLLASENIWGIISESIYVYPEFNEEKGSYSSINKIPKSLASNYYTIRSKKISKIINQVNKKEMQQQEAKK